MNKLKRVKGPGGVEAEWFEDKLEEVVEQASELPVTPDEPADESPSPPDQRVENIPLALAKIDPGAAIIAAFIPVEQAVADYFEARGLGGGPRSPMTLLRRDTSLPSDLKNVVIAMSRLRNEAAHSRDLDVSLDAAIRYIETAERLIFQLRFMTARVDFGFDPGDVPLPDPPNRDA
jgi:hypothetical protein